MKFKKNIALFLASYYLMISVGLTITLHFCGGSLASITPFLSETNAEPLVVESCCAKKAPEQECCNDEVIDFNDAKEESVLETFNFSVAFAVTPPVIQTICLQELLLETKKTLPNYTFQSNAPPRYKLYGTYIYYA